MRLASIKQIVPSLFLLALVVNAFPSGDRQDEGTVQAKRQVDLEKPRVRPGIEKFSKIVDDTIRNIRKATDRLDARTPDIKLVEKRNLEPAGTEMQGTSSEDMEKREAERNVAENMPKKLRRSTESQEMKAKLRARSEQEEYDRLKKRWHARNLHNKKVRHRNLKRLFQHGSPFQEYHNSIPKSAFAADDGSFSHSLAGKLRSLPNKTHKRFEGASPAANSLAGGYPLKARLQELGYKPQEDSISVGSSDQNTEKGNGDGILDSKITERNSIPGSGLRRRNLDQNIACPSLSAMSAMGTLFFSAGTYFWDMLAFRENCFNCNCRGKDGGYFMAEQQESGCTLRFARNCIMEGCRCLTTWDPVDPVLVPRPNWREKDKSGDATYASGVYNPQTKETYSDKYAAAAHIHEITFGL